MRQTLDDIVIGKNTIGFPFEKPKINGNPRPKSATTRRGVTKFSNKYFEDLKEVTKQIQFTDPKTILEDVKSIRYKQQREKLDLQRELDMTLRKKLKLKEIDPELVRDIMLEGNKERRLARKAQMKRSKSDVGQQKSPWHDSQDLVTVSQESSAVIYNVASGSIEKHVFTSVCDSYKEDDSDFDVDAFPMDYNINTTTTINNNINESPSIASLCHKLSSTYKKESSTTRGGDFNFDINDNIMNSANDITNYQIRDVDTSHDNNISSNSVSDSNGLNDMKSILQSNNNIDNDSNNNTKNSYGRKSIFGEPMRSKTHNQPLPSTSVGRNKTMIELQRPLFPSGKGSTLSLSASNTAGATSRKSSGIMSRHSSVSSKASSDVLKRKQTLLLEMERKKLQEIEDRKNQVSQRQAALQEERRLLEVQRRILPCIYLCNFTSQIVKMIQEKRYQEESEEFRIKSRQAVRTIKLYVSK
jgi:hypothetical protein